MPKLVITKEDVAKTLEARDKLLHNYVDDEKELDETFSQYQPSANHKDNVEEKIKQLNARYSTMAPKEIAKYMADKTMDVDNRIDAGDPTVAHEIAKIKIGNKSSQNRFVFATKYCSFQNPGCYPIFDAYVGEVFERLRSVLDCGPYSIECFRDKYWDGNKDCGYLRYKNVYDRFIELFGDAFPSKDYRTIDHYIWTSRKIASMKPSKKWTDEQMNLYNKIKASAINSFMIENPKNNQQSINTKQ